MMLKRTLIFGIWAAACLFAAADGFRNPPDTAAALGKADNHIVWVDDASAVFYNPANLVDVPSREVQLSGMLGYSYAEYSGQYGHTDTERPWSALPAFALAWPLHEKDSLTDLAAGLGIHVPYGRKTRWDSDGAYALTSEMSVIDASPSVAWRVSDSVSVGAGLDLYYGRLQFSRLLPYGTNAKVKADADGWAVGGNAGVTWRITPRQRIALTYTAPFDMKYTGEMKTANIPSPPFPPSEPESDIETTFKYPTIVALGYGLQVTTTLRVETKVEWLEFSRYKSMDIDAGGNSALASTLGLSHAAQNWDDTWTFGLGSEWEFVPDWTLRAGYLYLQSPIPDETFAPTALDVDQSLATLGLGYRTGPHAIDLAYAIGLFDDRDISTSENAATAGSYKFDGHLFAISYTYDF